MTPGLPDRITAVFGPLYLASVPGCCGGYRLLAVANSPIAFPPPQQ